ncbi:MAG TPA: hypothetical protein VL547_11710 [Dinghuibacter sp.]|jgi:hypothetical protein|uniref:hypothetical protein n=1 Tax=Dinghuibacter sp. TaxID=2024697 RepID=UPI002CDB395D|nr:hypothetical protein [Dinghuibacter sp.]HTJ12688.1 hypothetical protein [Dinghuibacter sp.]
MSRTRLAALAIVISASACRHPVTMEQKLNAWLIHERKMEVVLQDVRMDCDSTMEATLRFRTDSLVRALSLPPAQPAGHAHEKPHHHHRRS